MSQNKVQKNDSKHSTTSVERLALEHENETNSWLSNESRTVIAELANRQNDACPAPQVIIHPRYKYAKTIDLTPLLARKNFFMLLIGPSYSYEIDINEWPEQLTTLGIGNKYNHKIDMEEIDANLKHIWIGNRMSHEIEWGYLPNPLECLSIGNAYDHPIWAQTLPRGMVCVQIGNVYSHQVNFSAFSTETQILEITHSRSQIIAIEDFQTGKPHIKK